MINISNGNVNVEIDEIGASIRAINVGERSIMWNGDSKWWGRVAPFLFPIVGRLIDNEYIYNGNIYPLGQHGFLRDAMFKVVEVSKDSVTLRLESDEASKKVYPFDYCVDIFYAVSLTKVDIKACIKNLSDDTMLYSFGYHPAFNISDDAVWFSFEGQESLTQINYDGPYSTNKVPFNGHSVSLDVIQPQNDTLVLEGVTKVTMHDTHNTVSMDVTSYPYLGIWRPMLDDGTGAPFVCLEPWAGYGDAINHTRIFEDKVAIQRLDKQHVKEFNTTIEW